MENASKALVMAGGVLISILVASFMIFVLRKAGSMSAEYDIQMSDNELAKFNSQFEAYARDNNTFFDVITVANLAYDNNKKNGWDEQNGITVEIYEGGNLKYSILPSKIEKNHFFKGNDKNNSIYIYNEPQRDLGDKSIIDYYTEMNLVSNDNKQKYKYKFNCSLKNGIGGITYNEINGKVEKVQFIVEENN